MYDNMPGGRSLKCEIALAKIAACAADEHDARAVAETGLARRRGLRRDPASVRRILAPPGGLVPWRRAARR